MKRAASLTLVALLIGCLLMSGCSKSPSPKAGVSRPPGNLTALFKDNHGQVLVLLMGRDNCPGTARATKALDEYVSTKPQNVSVMRLDVPFTGEKLKLKAKQHLSFSHYVDAGRKITAELGFFYYPTTYVFDSQGEKRYEGGCDKDKIAAMAREILAEKPGAPKKIYSLPMPGVGQPAPAFSGSTLAGEAVTSDTLMKRRGLLICFSRTSCPFSAQEIPQFKDIAVRFRDKGVGVVVVNQQQKLDTIKPIYEQRCAGVPVIWDRTGGICKSYGVDAVPFYFLLDEDGKIVSQRSFTHTAAANSINSMLGLKAEKPRYKPTEGG